MDCKGNVNAIVMLNHLTYVFNKCHSQILPHNAMLFSLVTPRPRVNQYPTITLWIFD